VEGEGVDTGVLISFEMYFVTKYIFQRNLFDQDDPVPAPPTSEIFSPRISAIPRTRPGWG